MLQAENTSVYLGGFVQPVFDAQTVFRQVMNAMARPGTITRFDALTTPPAPLISVTGSIAAALFDHDTSVWLEPAQASQPALTGWLTFNTSTKIVAQGFDADFAIVTDAGALPSLESFAQGTQEFPDRSTTIILQVESLDQGPRLVLEGPGIKEKAFISPSGLPDQFCEQCSANRQRFPRGVDLLLVSTQGLIGLPRTVKISRG